MEERFWKDGNDQPKVIKAEDIKYWMHVPSLDMQEGPVSEDLDEAAKADAMIERPDDTEVGYDLNRYGGFISGAQWREEQMMKGAKLYGWIARDEDGTLHIFEDEPMRIKEEGRWWDRDYMSKPIEHGDFPDLKWEDEPIYVRLLIVKSE